jgi:hypothetical protein
VELLNPIPVYGMQDLPRPRKILRGKPRLGILGNSKANSAELMLSIRKHLVAEAIVLDGPFLQKARSSEPVSDAMVQSLTDEADLVLVGSAD